MYLKLFPELSVLKERRPLYNFISISNKCNANCIFCDIHEKKEISTNVDIHKLLFDLKNVGAEYVHFTGGGEPFANKEIFSYMEYATKLGLKIVIITNGYFLTEEVVNKLGEYNIVAMFFSIDSHSGNIHDVIRNVKGIFNRATSAINMIKRLYPNIKIVINHVLNNSNIDSLSEFIRLKESVNYDYLNPIIVKECPEYYFSEEQIKRFNNSVSNLSTLLREYNIELLYPSFDYFEAGKYTDDGSDLRKNDVPCKILELCTFIDCVSGNVYPCDCSVHRDSDYYAIGNVLEDSISNIFYSDKADVLRKKLIKCSKCKSKCDYANVYLNKEIKDE